MLCTSVQGQDGCPQGGDNFSSGAACGGVSLSFEGSVTAVLVKLKHLSAWDEFWGLGRKSPSGGIDVANMKNISMGIAVTMT